MVELSWKTQRDTISYQVSTPKGFDVQLENWSGKKLTLSRHR
jgi:hypothetical protein